MSLIAVPIIVCFLVVGWRLSDHARRIEVLESRPQPFHLHDKEMHEDD